MAGIKHTGFYAELVQLNDEIYRLNKLVNKLARTIALERTGSSKNSDYVDRIICEEEAEMLEEETE